MATHRKVYRFRMEPTAGQTAGLLRQAGARRWVWNWALARWREHYQATQTSISQKQLSDEFTRLKATPETAWLQEIDSQLPQQALRDLRRAFVAFFEKRARYPRFKSRKRDPLRFRIPQRVQMTAGTVYVPKVGWAPIRQSQPVAEPTKSATFRQEADGHWYVALTVEFDLPDTALPEPDPAKVVGIDLGLKEATVLSTGERVPAPRFFRRAERILRKVQKIAHQRQDFLHKLTTNIVQHYDGICIEDLAVNGLARTKLAKSIADAAMGEFRRQLTYKAEWHRVHLVPVDRWYPSSKRCSACGALNAALTLHDRSWTCVCGVTHDRDLNAAVNLCLEGLRLLAVGHTDSQNAQGDHVSPGTPGSGR